MLNRRDFLAGAGLAVAGIAGEGLLAQSSEQAGDAKPLAIDLEKVTGDLPHFWEKAVGSDRTAVGLRDQWRKDLVRAQRDTGIQSVRCHGLFDDEMGIAAEGAGRYNFLYLDQVYDFMLDHDVRPFVELSFMPEAFASSANRVFAYKGNTSPPRNWRDWYDMLHAFTDHCVKRYGIAEVSGWKFEAWNEPNIDFWSGTQADYFELYKQSALAIKSVDKRLQVGGPATARLAWVPAFIEYCVKQNLPIDFVSTHIYATDAQKPLFGQDNMYPFEQVIPRGVEMVKHQIESSAMPHLPLWITEWSAQNPALIAEILKSSIGLAEAMSFWTFSNVFEEQGVPTGIFNHSFGMLDQWSIARPSLHTFAFLHQLGEKRLQAGEGPVLATQRADGSAAILAWNLNLENASDKSTMSTGFDVPEGASRTLRLRLSGLAGRNQVKISQVNSEVGTALPTWKSMGSPAYPTSDQLQQLRSAAELPKPEIRTVTGEGSAEFSIVLPPNGVALLEFAV